MKWIVANDLKIWAERRDCQENLPLLVRRLIKATANRIGRISFPSGDNIQLSGWDGTLEAESGNENIPVGTSLWEISARQDIKSKANEDYDKRTENPQGFNIKESSFVFVTPRIWKGKEDWCNERKKEGKWKDVRVIAAENLEEWLDEAPSVAAWLGQIIGKFPTEGVQPTENFWDEWSSGPKIKLSSKLVIAGRSIQVNFINQNFLENKKIFSIQSSSRDESIAFLISAINVIGGGLHEDFFSRSIIVDNLQTFRQLVNNLNPLILIPRFEDEGVFNFAASKGHQIIIPLGADAGTGRGETIELSRLGREEFIEALKESGMIEEEAKQLSKESGRNLTIIRRQLEFELSVPIWAKPENFQDILPALLVGRWDDSKKGDKEIIEAISGKPYEDYILILTRWINTQDTPIYNIGGNWRLASPLDSWSYLARFSTTKIFEQLKNAFITVLSEKDPKLELEPDKRYMASIYGKNKKYSNWVREGLCQSLIIIAVYGQKLKMKTPTEPQIWIDFVVKELFKNASKEMWISLTDELPLIAEASPQSFMEAVEESLKNEVPEIMGMFEEQKSLLTPVSYHSGLLWALESLAWFPIHLARVAFILCDLSQKDPGGHLANRPLNTLRHIFLPWIPQTIANKIERLEVLNTLSEKYPDVAWDLFISLLPKDHDTGWNNSKTRWRKFAEKYENSVTYQEIWDVHTFLVEHLIKMSNNDEDKIAQIVNNMHTFSPIDRHNVVDHIDKNFKPENQSSFSIWHELRKILYRHRSYPDANWSLAEDELKKIESVFLKLFPTDIIERNIWLFNDHWPTIPEGFNHKTTSHEDHEKNILNKRIEGFDSIYKTFGVKRIIELIPRVQVIEIFGDVASYCIESDEDTLKLFDLLEYGEPNVIRFVQNFIFRNSILKGFAWVKANYDRISHLSKIAKSRYFELIPQSKELWDLIESTNSEIAQGYWQSCYPRFYHLSLEEKIYGIKKLISVNRLLSAIGVSSHFKKELPSDLILEMLEKAGITKSDEKAILDGYEIEWLFEELDLRNDYNIERLVKLEWLYLPVINSLVSTRKPKLLHNELSTNPDFFVEVIKWIWKPEPGKNIQNEFEGFSEEEIVRRADIAYQLLYTWNKVPGTNEENYLDAIKLNDWVKQVREKCNFINRLNAAEIQIGIIFAKYSFDKNDWPLEPICQVIDSINSEYINDGFTSGIINNRGVVTKSFLEGGTQEQELAKTYEGLAKKIATKYPITSSLLLEISKRYVAESKREDERAETNDLEY